MEDYICIYYPYEDDIELEVFRCNAEDADHAREQCQNAYPSAFIAECYLEGEV